MIYYNQIDTHLSLVAFMFSPHTKTLHSVELNAFEVNCFPKAHPALLLQPARSLRVRGRGFVEAPPLGPQGSAVDVGIVITVTGSSDPARSSALDR